jgi:hypothetical protein
MGTTEEFILKPLIVTGAQTKKSVNQRDTIVQ